MELIFSHNWLLQFRCHVFTVASLKKTFHQRYWNWTVNQLLLALQLLSQKSSRFPITESPKCLYIYICIYFREEEGYGVVFQSWLQNRGIWLMTKVTVWIFYITGSCCMFYLPILLCFNSCCDFQFWYADGSRQLSPGMIEMLML